MFNLFYHLNKTGNFKFCWSIVFLNMSEKPSKKEDKLNKNAIWLIFFRQVIVNSSMKYNYLKTKFF